MPVHQRVLRIVEPMIWFAGLLVLWELAVRLGNVPSYVLPAPSEFMLRIFTDYQRLGYHGLITTKLIIYGFLAGAIPGVMLGYLVARSKLAELTLYPMVVFIQGLPKITLAPLMLVWFGFADFPKILLTALITFFPVLVDSAHGFRSIDRRQYYLSKSVGASWWQTFRLFELPSAAPSIFAGFKTTIVIAVTVVIVVEWLNSQDGLGYLVLRGMDSSDTSLIFAVLVVGSLIGVLLSAGMAMIERVCLPWKQV
ncbi:ABC transporter permease [Nitratireductor sp. GISD-1A_MAKvit]|uniref:ABC transporter permease n=1 Tax=Nitratireductor sp. GISD-1A_MAKvit TaxID=3234198 RepID=UPI003467116F